MFRWLKGSLILQKRWLPTNFTKIYLTKVAKCYLAKVLPNVEVCSVGETTRFVPSANSSSDCSAADTDIWSLLANSSVADYSRIEPEIKRLLNDRGFVKTEENEKQPEFQALSLELINNWKCEWWRQVVHNSGTEIRIEREDPGSANESGSLKDEVPGKFLDNLKLGARKTPLAAAINVLSTRGEKDTLGLFVLVETRKSNLELENLISAQRKFFRKYFRKPAKMAVKGSTHNTDKNPTASNFLVYEHNGFTFDIAAASAFCDKQLAGETLWQDIRCMFDGKPLSLLKFGVNIRNLVYATYVDAYHVISFPNYHATLMCIHPYLAPVKVAVAVEGESEKLNELKDYMCAVIRRMDLNCWDATEMNLEFEDLDLSGVMYVVIITDRTVDDGLVFIRDRNTSVKMEAHITEVTDKLYLYLNPR